MTKDILKWPGQLGNYNSIFLFSDCVRKIKKTLKEFLKDPSEFLYLVLVCKVAFGVIQNGVAECDRV